MICVNGFRRGFYVLIQFLTDSFLLVSVEIFLWFLALAYSLS